MDWVSVNDSLPTSMANKVIVCCENGYVGFGHYEKFHGVEEWYNLESGKPFSEWGDGYNVTHWMCRPNPPQN